VRTAVVTLALLVALVTAVVAGVPSVSAGDTPAVPATASVVVQPGQTLWSVAREVAPGADVRETVARIKDLNNLSGPSSDVVVPGQQLVVPAAG
jgi:LysM repeat protein